MKKALLALILAMIFVGQMYSLQDARLLRFPDTNGDLVVFVYAGDIWSVSAQGGSARRLTGHAGMELFPKISPDGKWIAFSGEYSGSRQVYVMPSQGGTPRQLTYYNDAGVMPPRGGYDYVVLDWTADSRQIMIRANRTPWGERMGRYYLISLDGGMEKPLPIPEAGGGRLSPDNRMVVYTPISREFRTWKRTKGGRAQDVWTYDLEKNVSKRLTDFPGTDQHPIWYKDKIYFVSDRELVLNFFSYDLKSGEIERITRFEDYDVLWPSGRFGKLAFEKGGYINILDLDSGNSHKIDVAVEFDNPNVLPFHKNVSEFVTRFGYHISPTGKRAVFDARGDIYTVPAENGRTENLTRSSGVREFYPVWSPDGKWIACYSDQSGDYELMLIDPSNMEKPQTLTQGHKVWKYPAVWSPDSRKLAFSDKNQNLQIIDIKSHEITVVDQADLNEITDYSWSPDSLWLAYSKNAENDLGAIWLYSLEMRKSRQLLDNRYSNSSPVFSKCGRYLFFSSLRDFNWTFSGFEFDYVFNNGTRLFAVSLDKSAPNLFVDKNDVEAVKSDDSGGGKKTETKEEEKKKNEKEEIKALKVDFEGIESRVMVLPLPAANYQPVAALDGKLLYFNDGGLYLFDLEKKKSELVVNRIRGVALSRDGKKLLYRSGKDYGIVDVAPGKKVGDGKLDLTGMTMKIDPVLEWRQIFNEGWRIFRDWFYVQNMHGVDWEKIRKKYEVMLPSLAHRSDLDFIFGEMVGELNAGHTYVNWGDFPRVKRMETGLLGAELEADEKAGRYRIKKMFASENWNEHTRSPLTEVGIDVRVGDYLLSLNGFDVTLKDNPYRFLENTVDRRIEITVSAKGDGSEKRTYWIKPVGSELKLMSLDWVESRRRLVEKLSGGRIGYVYVPDTADDGHREFYKGLYSQTHKEAWIIDDRYNGGGYDPAKMTEIMSRKITSYWHSRGLRLQRAPGFVLDGPKVMLINHYSSSGGDNFPYLFRKNNLGKLIGTRTWGGLVGYSWSPSLVDGPSFAVPMSGIVGTDGEWAVEGMGIYPDIVVYDLPEEIVKGNDPCIEKAVEVLLEELIKNPGVKDPKNPPQPDRSKWFEKEIR